MCTREAGLFRVLGVESRIKIIRLLKEKGPMGVNRISEVLDITPSAVSQHLKLLKFAGLVRSQRKGYWVPYEVDAVALERCGMLLFGVCACGCAGAPGAAQADLPQGKDRVKVLKQYERELQKRLREVQAQIKMVQRRK